jgi:hypothetical protein
VKQSTIRTKIPHRRSEFISFRVSEATKKRWKQIRRKYDLSSEEILNLALDYFEKYYAPGLVF